MSEVACVIPALDAAATLATVVGAIREAVPKAWVVVVDDGSRDATAAIATMCADRVERLTSNRGKGVALRAGFAAAVAHGATTILTLDADGQHDAASAPDLLGALGQADVVIGVRSRRGTRMPIVRRASNAVSAAAVSVCAGRRFADSQTGFRAFGAAVLNTIAPMGDRYEYETDFLIQVARAGLRVACVPVATIYGPPSHFRPWRDTARVVGMICRRLPTGGWRRQGRRAAPSLGSGVRPGWLARRWRAAAT